MTAPRRILVVDDEPNVRLMFRTALETAGFEVTTAEDGKAAIEIVEAGEPSFSLITIDLNMPVMGGMETLRRLRELGSRVPAVVVTAHGDVPNAVEAMRLGAIDFLLKPVTPVKLRKAVSEIIGRHVDRPSIFETTEHPEPITVQAEFERNLARAKRAFNHQWLDEAEIFLKQAVALMPDSAEAHNLMGVLQELKGDHGASYQSYREALRADKNFEPAKHNMLRYYERFTFGRSDVPLDIGER